MNLLLVIIAAVVVVANGATLNQKPVLQAATTSQTNELHAVLIKMAHMERTLESLTRQVMLQQLFIEEKIRTDGDSGLKAIRQTFAGTTPYYAQSFSPNIAAIHDHTNYDRTIGMGELNVVMNGVEFRTRHNDYKLRMPSKTRSTYEHLEDIPFPAVPSQVLQKHTVQEQITEMREWFKAWKDQDHSVRDYRNYFKAVLCYLEGAWTTDTKTLHEPFSSDRHFIDASSWFDLQDKVRFTSYTGSKSTLENFAYLPTKIMSMRYGVPQYAQWNYRIVCHPTKQDLPLHMLRVVDDMSVRNRYKSTFDRYVKSRGARFYLTYNSYSTSDRSYRNGMLDELMHEIPGKDNYIGNITDNAFGEDVLDSRSGKLLNTAYYHRFYKLNTRDAMGVRYHKRGFNDNQLFVAETKQPRVAAMSAQGCHNERRQVTSNHHTHWVTRKICKTYSQRVSYAIPLEIIYLTPLYRWNPYKLANKGSYHTSLGQTVSTGGRNGGLTTRTAFNGINSKYYYLTPADFFEGGEAHSTAADTTRGVAGVLGPDGQVKRVKASGTRIFLPDIQGVGSLRTRYPIMPVHAEGDATFKELKAFEDYIFQNLNLSDSAQIVYNPINGGHHTPHESKNYTMYQMGTTIQDPPGEHTHDVRIYDIDLKKLISGQDLTVVSEMGLGHHHELVVSHNNKGLFIKACDTHPHCWDGHDNSLTRH